MKADQLLCAPRGWCNDFVDLKSKLIEIAHLGPLLLLSIGLYSPSHIFTKKIPILWSHVAPSPPSPFSVSWLEVQRLSGSSGITTYVGASSKTVSSLFLCFLNDVHWHQRSLAGRIHSQIAKSTYKIRPAYKALNYSRSLIHLAA